MTTPTIALGRDPLVRRWPASALIALLGLGVAVALALLAVDKPTLAIGAGAAALLTFVIALNPNVATLAVLAILYSNAAVIAVKLHGLPYFVGAAVPLLLVGPVAYLLIARRQVLIITSAFPWILAFLVIQLVGTLFSSDPAAASKQLVTFSVEGIGLYLLVTNVVRTPEMLRQVVWLLLTVGAFLGALSLYQQLTHTFGNDYFGFAQVSRAAFGTGQEDLGREILQPRLAGPLGDQNRYAQILLVLVPLGLFRYSSERSGLLRLLAAGATALIALGVALTFSRGAAVGFALLLVIMTFLRNIKLRQLAVIAIGLVLLFLLVPGYWTRLSSLSSLSGAAQQQGSQSQVDSSIRSRATENLAALLIFADHPIVGVGPGLYPSYYRRYSDRVGDYANVLDVRVKNANRKAHDLYLGVAAETGILGLAAFAAILLVTLRDLARARRRWLRSRPEWANAPTGFLLAVVVYMATGLFLHLAYVRYFSLLIALAGAASFVALNQAADDAAPAADEA